MEQPESTHTAVMDLYWAMSNAVQLQLRLLHEMPSSPLLSPYVSECGIVFFCLLYILLSAVVIFHVYWCLRSLKFFYLLHDIIRIAQHIASY